MFEIDSAAHPSYVCTLHATGLWWDLVKACTVVYIYVLNTIHIEWIIINYFIIEFICFVKRVTSISGWNLYEFMIFY